MKVLFYFIGSLLRTGNHLPCHVMCDDEDKSLLHSCAGHSDVVMGALILNDDDIASRLRFLQNGKQVSFSLRSFCTAYL